LSNAARLDALNLAGDLPGILLDAKRLAASAPGVHGRRRAGQGEDFWQYRDHRAEDGARLVDWRRSARGDRYYVRDRARVIALALATLLARGGERIGALGMQPRAGARAVDRLAIDLTTPQGEFEPPNNACIIFISDFYAPIEIWRERLLASARVGASGALVMIADPAEEDFPFRGRTLFQSPGRSGDVLIGRAENAQAAYVERLAQQRRELRALGAELGFPALLHRTDHSASPALSMLMAFVSERYG